MTTDGQLQQTGATPGAAQAGTPPATMTREEHEKAVQKAVLDAKSAVLADVGRQRKAAEDALKAAHAARERLELFERERAQAELEAARDNPAQLTALQERQRRRELEKQIAERDDKLSAQANRLAEYESREAELSKQRIAHDVAARLNVDAAKLASLSRFTDGSLEAIEALAKELPQAGKKPGATFKPDSNDSVGGGVGWEEIRAAFIKDPYDPKVRQEYFRQKGLMGR